MTSVEAAWYADAWNNRIKLTIQRSQVNGSVAEFPVYVNLDDMPDSFFQNCNNNGTDLRVTTSDGSTEVAREVVYVDKASKLGELWFKATSLSNSSNAGYYLYYGNVNASEPAAASSYGSQAVWSNGFVAVYHMNALTNGTASVLDSTSYANHGTPYGGMTSGALVTGKTGKAISFDGANDYIDCGVTGGNWVENSNFTVSMWLKPNGSIGTSNTGLISKDQSGPYPFSIRTNGSTNLTILFDSTGNLTSTFTPSANVWSHISFILNSTSGRTFYGNSVLNISDASTTPPSSDGQSLYIATDYAPNTGRHFNGVIDNILIANKPRNGNWIKTEYNNQNSTTSFYTVNGQETNFTTTNYPYKTKITINAAQVNGSVAEFPVYLDLNGMPAHFFANVTSSGADIRMTTSDLVTQVPLELVSFSKTTTNGELWFKASSLSSASNTDYYLWYGFSGASMPSASSAYGSQAVWSNGFVAVYHMNALTNGTASVLDSTSYVNHGTPRGGMSTLITGKTGKAISFDGANDYIKVTPLALNTSTCTISNWLNLTTSKGSHGIMESVFSGVKSGLPYFLLQEDSGTLKTYNQPVGYANLSSTSVATWYNYASSRTSTTELAYQNSTVYVNRGISTGGHNSEFNIGVGYNNFFTGSIDEVRISNKARNGNWIKTEYNNQNSPASFYTITDMNTSTSDQSLFLYGGD